MLDSLLTDNNPWDKDSSGRLVNSGLNLENTPEIFPRISRTNGFSQAPILREYLGYIADENWRSQDVILAYPKRERSGHSGDRANTKSLEIAGIDTITGAVISNLPLAYSSNITPTLPTITITASDANAAETNVGQTANPGLFTFTRTGSTASSLSVNYTIGGGAINGIDYSKIGTTITFAAGQSSVTLPINIINDTLVEPSETLTLTLASNSAYTIGTSSSAMVTIVDNDIALPTVTITANDANAAEVGSGQPVNPGQFTFTRTGNISSALTVNYNIGGGATNGSDYNQISNSITFAEGVSSVTLPINVINDSLIEGNETVVITLAANSAYSIGSSNSATVAIADFVTGDWFSQNLRDPQLISTTRSLAGDNNLSRSDMISLFRNATDGGIVDANELTDLRTLVTNASRFNMADHVRVLSNKIANGNIANERSGIGNLFAGSSTNQMENLIGKWFLGTDRPTAPNGFTMTYVQASGTLFGNDGTFNYQDINQGYLGDCYFLASLGATARQRPSAIQNMFINNGDGTFTVRFFGQNNGTVNTPADYVTVDQWLPTNIAGTGSDGVNYTQQRFARYDNGNLGLWVALAEKAYAQFAESGLAQRPVTTDSYGSIVGGLGYQAMPSITGSNGGFYSNINYAGNRLGNMPNLATISSLLGNGRPMSAGTISSPTLGIVGSHEYVVVSANTSNNTLNLYNPWAVTRQGEVSGMRTISYNDFVTNFDLLHVG